MSVLCLTKVSVLILSFPKLRETTTRVNDCFVKISDLTEPQEGSQMVFKITDEVGHAVCIFLHRLPVVQEYCLHAKVTITTLSP